MNEVNNGGLGSCPRCGSDQIEQRGKLFFFLIPLTSAGCLSIIGLLLSPFMTLAILIAIISPLSLFMPKTNHCTKCHYSWVPKWEAKNGKTERPYDHHEETMESASEKMQEQKVEYVATDISGVTLDRLYSPEESQDQKVRYVSFNVAGVTFQNDEEKEIQTLLRRIAKAVAIEKDIPSYSGLSNAEILEYEMDVSEFEDVDVGDYIRFEKNPDNEFDKNAIKVLVEMPNGKKYHIGHVPKKNNIEVGKLMDDGLIKSIDAKFVGGRIKDVDRDYDSDHDRNVVVIKELTLGVQVTLHIEGE